jgi:hypothetical protein
MAELRAQVTALLASLCGFDAGAALSSPVAGNNPA